MNFSNSSALGKTKAENYEEVRENLNNLKQRYDFVILKILLKFNLISMFM